MNKEIVSALCDWHDNLIAVRHMRSGPDHPDVVRAKELIQLARNGSALEDIAAERRRQINVEGWAPAHDDEYNAGEMALAAASYAISDHMPTRAEQIWPWDMSWWKPANRRRNLVKAGALIVAEIERIDRSNSPKDMARPIHFSRQSLT